MSTATKPLRNERGQFQLGSTGNPAGRPKGSRNRLGEEFLAALADDFAQHGREAVAECRVTNPSAYVRVIAALLPKEAAPVANGDFASLSDDELRRYLIESLRGMPGLIAQAAAFTDDEE